MNEAKRSSVEGLVDRLQDSIDGALQNVCVAWTADDMECVYVREDVAEERTKEEFEDIGVDLLADRHLEVGNLRRHGLEGPIITGRLYQQALMVISWIEGWPVAVAADPDPRYFPDIADAIQALAQRSDQ